MVVKCSDSVGMGNKATAMVLAKTMRTNVSTVYERAGCESAGSSNDPGAWRRQLASDAALARRHGKGVGQEGREERGRRQSGATLSV